MSNNIKLLPSNLKGKVLIPPSKSLAHRYLIGAALSSGNSYIKHIAKSVDIVSTMEALEGLGVIFEEEKVSEHISNYKVQGVDRPKITGNGVFDCQESGSTLRFLIPLLLLSNVETRVVGKGKLVERPLDVYYELFEEKGIDYSNNSGCLPLTLKGGLKGGTYKLRGNVSSQFITGLLYALPLVEEDSIIELTTVLESKPYVDLTLDVLKKFGIKIEVSEDYRLFKISGKQKYHRGIHTVEGDYSQVAFYGVAGTIGKAPITCMGLNESSLQGDRVIVDFIKLMGGRVEREDNDLTFYPSITKGVTLDVTECPDLVPALTLLGSLSQGTTHIVGAERLKIKESNRLESSASELNKLGAKVQVESAGLLIEGVNQLVGDVFVDSWNDHRIAMTLAMATNRIDEPITLSNWQSVNKSYPNFWEDFKQIGGRIDE